MQPAQHNLDTARLTRLIEVGRELNSAANLDDLLKLIITEAANLTDAEAASILLLDPATRELRFKATSGAMVPALADTPVPLDSSIAGAILTSNAPLIVDDVTQDHRWNPQVAQLTKFATRSILGVPMHDRATPVGVLEALNKRNRNFTQGDVAILAIVADLAGVAVEKARLIDELRRANQKLSDLDRLKSNFIALASHELRTPLAIILGYVSLLRDAADPALTAQLTSVLDAAVRLRGLIQDMLNLQYVDAGKLKAEPAPIDLAGVVRRLVAERGEMAAVKQQTFRADLAARPCGVLADQRMLDVIVANLLNNALKFTPKGGRIEVRLQDRGTEVWLSVADSGVGIPADQFERIFDRFYQVEPHLRRHHEGMGVGLAIAKDLVELNHGRIWVRSEVGKGSEFFVALPSAAWGQRDRCLGP
jgi:signal transduction histidine kinase